MNEILSRNEFFQKVNEEIRSFLPDDLKDLQISLDKKEEKGRKKEDSMSGCRMERPAPH